MAKAAKDTPPDDQHAGAAAIRLILNGRDVAGIRRDIAGIERWSWLAAVAAIAVPVAQEATWRL